MIGKVVVCAPALALLTACDSSSTSRLSGEVSHFVSIGSPIEKAKLELKADGFHCGNNYWSGPEEVMCDRLRSYKIMATCVQRVLISLDASKTRVARIEIPSIPCAGM